MVNEEDLQRIAKRMIALYLAAAKPRTADELRKCLRRLSDMVEPLYDNAGEAIKNFHMLSELIEEQEGNT